jgi:hypothetical protein
MSFAFTTSMACINTVLTVRIEGGWKYLKGTLLIFEPSAAWV